MSWIDWTETQGADYNDPPCAVFMDSMEEWATTDPAGQEFVEDLRAFAETEEGRKYRR